MLLELRIENLLLIERTELRFGPGLNVITGETGAGKTVLAHSLDLLMGGKARPQIVRPGTEEAYVEGVFDPPEGLLDDPELADLAERIDVGDEIVLGRRVFASGRTSAFVQGRSASAADLKVLGSRLLAFYGQHEHRKLTLSSAQLEILDGFAGSEHLARRDEYRAKYAERGDLHRHLTDLLNREGARERDIDLLRFELEEIETAAPEESERLALDEERMRLRHTESLLAAAGAGVGVLTGEDDGNGAVALLAVVSKSLASVEGVDANLDVLARRLAASSLELEDLAADLRNYLDSVEAEPGRLQEIEERLETIERLERKYGGSVADVLAHAEECRRRLDSIENSEQLTAEARAALDTVEAELGERATVLTETRRRAAVELSTEIEAALSSLAMDGAKLEVVLNPQEGGDFRLGPNGAEAVELRVATNPGMPPSPLRDAASGGELSRVMLALSGAGRSAASGTMVFDEIDAGVGGKTGRIVGERLRDLGENGQVVCITHLAQIASLAATHFRVVKEVVDGATRARVESIEGEELVGEIVRMLGGEQSADAANRHARELLAAA